MGIVGLLFAPDLNVVRENSDNWDFQSIMTALSAHNAGMVELGTSHSAHTRPAHSAPPHKLAKPRIFRTKPIKTAANPHIFRPIPHRSENARICGDLREKCANCTDFALRETLGQTAPSDKVPAIFSHAVG